MSYRLKKNWNQFAKNLFSLYRSPEELTSYVEQEHSDEDVTVTVKVPEHAQNPEYALQVNARQQGSNGPYDNVVNYLLTHGRDQVSDDNNETLVSQTDYMLNKLVACRLSQSLCYRNIFCGNATQREVTGKGLSNFYSLTPGTYLSFCKKQVTL